MKACMECGKNLGIIEGYRHPTMGKEYLLCSKCFDTVFESVEKYREFISPYVGFFNRESSTIEDLQKIGVNISKRIQNMQNKINKLWLHNANKKTNDNLPIVHQHNIDTYSG